MDVPRVHSNTGSYLTPPSSQAFPPHDDHCDIFTIQLIGNKQWKPCQSLSILVDELVSCSCHFLSQCFRIHLSLYHFKAVFASEGSSQKGCNTLHDAILYIPLCLIPAKKLCTSSQNVGLCDYVSYLNFHIAATSQDWTLVGGRCCCTLFQTVDCCFTLPPSLLLKRILHKHVI